MRKEDSGGVVPEEIIGEVRDVSVFNIMDQALDLCELQVQERNCITSSEQIYIPSILLI